ncbi:PLP-dependent transferase [Aspergillus ellipticus CBS 707.79]|uniref:PLP-dependent transferase n=1 Tax=Aspergillus ellipticus CBS 707.79 TaxID=1448320 RepID=A0A319D104_9EURO|nr:PLP-dependent transferase [Aspergillus ellipticus CBS 707.79]
MSSAPTPTPFGAPMREHFLIGPEYRNLNHGSYGTYPAPIRQTLHSYQTLAESHPDTFIRLTQPAALRTSRHHLSTILNTPASNCVLVRNATTGVATILHNIPFTPGDVAIYFSTVYGAVEYGLRSLTERTPLQLREVPYEFPLSHADLVQRFRAAIKTIRDEGLNPKIAVFDVVVSVPGVRLPFEELVKVCKEEGVLSLVDGAHGVGMLEIDLGALGVDFLTSNLHKYVPFPSPFYSSLLLCCVLYYI